MQIQINTDSNVHSDEELNDRIKHDIETRLGHFGEHITRIEVHLSDENGDKKGPPSKRCLIEVRAEGRKPEAVSNQEQTMEGAYKGAVKKLQHSLESTLGRLNHKKGEATIRANEP